MKDTIITKEIARELLDYNPFTGLFTWKYRELEWFDPDGWNGGGTRGNLRNQRSWNGKHAGKPAFCTPYQYETNTYLRGIILWESQAAHRMAFMWMKGYFPVEIDHRDGDGTNNRWRNIHEVTRSVNMQNRRRSRFFRGKPLIHEHHGIKWNGDRYGARITRDGVNIWIGTFDTLEEAIEVRKRAERELGFSERHGS